MFKYLLLFLSCLIGCLIDGKIEAVPAAPYETPQTSPRIISIDLYNHRIDLSNGTSWEIIDYQAIRGRQLELWHVGDKISLSTEYFISEGYLMNLNIPSSYYTSRRPEYVTLNARPISLDGVSNILTTDGDYSITLSDGSKWSIGWWSALKSGSWKVGERILISPQWHGCATATHWLINLDTNNYVNATLEPDM